MIVREEIGRNIYSARAAARQRGGQVGQYTFGIGDRVTVFMPFGEKTVCMRDPYAGYRELADFICSRDA